MVHCHLPAKYIKNSKEKNYMLLYLRHISSSL